MKIIRNTKLRLFLILILGITAVILGNLKITSELVQAKVDSISPIWLGGIKVTLHKVGEVGSVNGLDVIGLAIDTDGKTNYITKPTSEADSKKYHVKVYNDSVKAQVSRGGYMVVKSNNYSLFGRSIQSDKFNVVKIKMSRNQYKTGDVKEYKVLAEIKESNVYKYKDYDTSPVKVELVVELQDKVGGAVHVNFDVYNESLENTRRKYASGGLITLKKSIETGKDGKVMYLNYDYQSWGYDGLEYEPEK